MDNKLGTLISHLNIGNIYFYQFKVEKNQRVADTLLIKVKQNYEAALKISESINSMEGLASAYGSLGNFYFEKKEYGKARTYFIKNMEFCKESGYNEMLKETYNNLSKLDSATLNYKGAYENHKLYILYRDSLNNDETQKKAIQQQMSYDYEKKSLTDSLRVQEEKKVFTAQLKAEKTKNFALYGGLVLVILFAGFMYNRFKITQKQKGVIEEQKVVVEKQKHLVEEKQKEILDSIAYARRIQMALIPTDKKIQNSLNKLQKRA